MKRFKVTRYVRYINEKQIYVCVCVCLCVCVFVNSVCAYKQIARNKF